jgi:beta-mannosidase
VLHAQLFHEDRLADSKEHYFVPAKRLLLGSPSIRVTEIEGSRFVLETDVLAKQVWLSSEMEGIFSDNYFDLIPTVPVTVEFYARGAGKTAWTPSTPGRIQVRSMAEFVK